MASARESFLTEIIDLRGIESAELEPLLEEESAAWHSALAWDFSASADLVRRFIKIQALSGYVLRIAGRPVGYSYYVCEEKKALIGDLYLLREFATPENELSLLNAMIGSLAGMPYLSRIEAQLMMLQRIPDKALPVPDRAEAFERWFLMIDLPYVPSPREPSSGPRMTFRTWNDASQDEAAGLIASAYEGHVDSRINDQYRSFAGAKRFLMNIVQYPGCGSFCAQGSIVAQVPDGGLAGLCLTSIVAPNVGHITQVCVRPELRGLGIGYQMLRLALDSLHQRGCTKVSLTVTGTNSEATRLYLNMGFRKVRSFGAYVWADF